jgi:hypothetical protein
MEHHHGRLTPLGLGENSSQLITRFGDTSCRGLSSLNVLPHSGEELVEIEVTRSRWPLFANGRVGKTTTSGGGIKLNRNQLAELHALLGKVLETPPPGVTVEE